ncbi:MAG: Rpp14/Pop5 family protein [Candidatus Micrarchaeota archaeon]
MVYKPTMREKRRYVLFEVKAESAIGERDAREGIYDGLLKFLGEYGSSLAGPKVLEFDEKSARGVLRCARDEIVSVKAALALMNNIAGRKAAVRALGVSGTIKKLKSKRSAREESL